MNDLEKYFSNNKGNLICKWKHYFDIYETYFQKFRNRAVTVLEIGVFHGGSLHMWKDYFGPHARIYGVDINPNCKALEDDQIKVFIGSQEDRKFLRNLVKTLPKIDILVDDGGHTMRQQITTFEELYAHVNENGIYLCEDLHTSYWKWYGGKFAGRKTFIEYSKHLIDYLNAWHSETRRLQVNDFTKTAYALHYYDSVLVIEKKKMGRPCEVRSGFPVINQVPVNPVPFPKRIYRALRAKMGI